MKPLLPLRQLIVLILVLYSVTTLAQRTLTTIAVHHADPDLLIRVIQPQLSPGSSVSLYQNQLVINATVAEQRKIQKLVKQLDGSGRQIVFSLRREGANGGAQQQLKVEGNVGIGDREISSGQQGIRSETRTTVTVQHRGFSGSTQSGQGIRGTEGAPAYIATGASIAVHSYSSAYDGQISRQTEPVDISSGFYATAWIDGDTVTVSIDQRDNRYQQGIISTQQLQSRVSGQLGGWIPIGVITEGQQLQQRELNSRGASSASDTTTIYLKVELQP